MSEKRTATDWERLEKMSDEDIDYSDIPPLNEAFFENATIRMPVKKKAISLRVDEDVLEWYKRQGKGYQTRMNAVLRMGMVADLKVENDHSMTDS